MVMGGTIVLGGVHRFGRSLASAAGQRPDRRPARHDQRGGQFHDVFAKRGKMGA